MGKCRMLKINKARFRWKSRWLRPEIFLKYMQDDETNCHKSRIRLTLKKTSVNLTIFTVKLHNAVLDCFCHLTPQLGHLYSPKFNLIHPKSCCESKIILSTHFLTFFTHQETLNSSQSRVSLWCYCCMYILNSQVGLFL